VTPATASARLTIGGVSATVLAEVYGTPLLAFDTDVFDATVARFERAAAAARIDVAYAAKALLVTALARRLRATGLNLDVCSLGELAVAERAGFPAERLVLHGCGKTDDELAAAVDGRVGRIVCDNLEEIERLAEIARAGRGTLDVLLRVNTGIEAHTHEFVRTGGEDSKFGFSLASVDDAAVRILASPGLCLIGLHAHIGSQIFESEPYGESLAILLERYARLAALGAPLREVIAGGGYGVDPYPGGATLDIEAIFDGLRARLDAECVRLQIPTPRLGVEPGRALAAQAGTSLYRVVAVKQQGKRRFAIVDGGLADNPRPLLYDAYHHPELANRRSSAPLEETTLCGRSCENDRIVVAALPGDLAAGDLIALRTTGAYTFSMASNYNRFPRPPVAFAGGGAHRAVVRRETLDDLERTDLDA
jgi:diaminopimelate decarboxylase